MVTTLQRREIAKWLQAQGFTLELINQRGPQAQWYLPDGTPLANKLPADSYHLQRFRARGWSLLPPPPVSEGFKVHWNGETWDIISPKLATDALGHAGVPNRGSTAIVATNISANPHHHAYNKAMGSPCKMPGCTAVRTTPYKPRGKKGD